MKKNQILAAWRDEEYFLSLTEEERAQIPQHPAGVLDLEDETLKSITGGCAYTAAYGCPTTGYCTPCYMTFCSA